MGEGDRPGKRSMLRWVCVAALSLIAYKLTFMRPLALDNLIVNLQQLDRRVQQSLPNPPLHPVSQSVSEQHGQSSNHPICHVRRQFHQLRIRLANWAGARNAA